MYIYVKGIKIAPTKISPGKSYAKVNSSDLWDGLGSDKL